MSSVLPKKQHLTIRLVGKVHSILFQQSTKNIAEGLGITGFTRPNFDSSLTIEAEGSPIALEELMRWSEVGPQKGTVHHIEVELGGLQHYTTFSIEEA